MSEFLIGFAFAASCALLLGMSLKDVPANSLRANHCGAICSPMKAGVAVSTPSLCVCKNGRTFPGKAPEFYEVKR